MTGKELRRLRLRAGLTQLDLAKTLGIHRNVVSYLERGVRPILRHLEIAIRCVVEHRGR